MEMFNNIIDNTIMFFLNHIMKLESWIFVRPGRVFSRYKGAEEFLILGISDEGLGSWYNVLSLSSMKKERWYNLDIVHSFTYTRMASKAEAVLYGE